MTLIFLDSMDNQLLINSNSAVTLDRNYCMHFGDVSAIANYASALVTYVALLLSSSYYVNSTVKYTFTYESDRK